MARVCNRFLLPWLLSVYFGELFYPNVSFTSQLKKENILFKPSLSVVQSELLVQVRLQMEAEVPQIL